MDGVSKPLRAVGLTSSVKGNRNACTFEVRGMGAIEKFPFATRELRVLRTGFALAPGGRPAHAGTENVQRPPGCRAEPDTHTGHVGELFNGTGG